MDKLIGRLVARLDELGLRQKTLVLFTGDNGTGRGITSKMGEVTVEGGKGTMTDAGMRVPLIANWPGTIPARQGFARPGRYDRFPADAVRGSGREACPRASSTAAASCRSCGAKRVSRASGSIAGTRPIKARSTRRGSSHATSAYKLFADGKFYEIDSRRYEEKELEGQLSPEAAAAKKKLQGVLDQFREARPKELAAR